MWNHPRLQTLSATGRLRAWTGGCRPQPVRNIGAEERQTVKAFFREQIGDYQSHWNETPCRGILRTFWIRARYDAHATHRPN